MILFIHASPLKGHQNNPEQLIEKSWEPQCIFSILQQAISTVPIDDSLIIIWNTFNQTPLFSPKQKKEMLMAKPVKELSGFLPYGRIGLI